MLVRNNLQTAIYFVFKVRMGTEVYEPPADENLVRCNLQYTFICDMQLCINSLSLILNIENMHWTQWKLIYLISLFWKVFDNLVYCSDQSINDKSALLSQWIPIKKWSGTTVILNTKYHF